MNQPRIINNSDSDTVRKTIECERLQIEIYMPFNKDSPKAYRRINIYCTFPHYPNSQQMVSISRNYCSRRKEWLEVVAFQHRIPHSDLAFNAALWDAIATIDLEFFRGLYDHAEELPEYLEKTLPKLMELS